MNISFIIGAFSNAIRGGQWRAWFGIDDSRLRWASSDAINAGLWCATVYIATSHAALALVSAPMMWIGAKPGWGDYIGAIGGWRENNLKEIRTIDWIISPLKSRPELWGWAGLSIRGLFWGACLAAPFAYFGLQWQQFLLVGASMPLWYWLAIKWLKYRAPDSWQGTGWALGEIFFGAVLWSCL
jgi:hypothetical protein